MLIWRGVFIEQGHISLLGDIMVFKRRSLMSMAAAFAFAFGWIAPTDASEQATSAPVVSSTIVANSDDAAVLWDWLKDSSDQSQLERFIKRYPNSPYVVNARIRLEMLKHPGSASVSIVRAPKPAPSTTSVVRTAGSSRYSQLQCWGFWCGWQFPIVLGIGF
jgi:hypothetical protein